MLMQEIQNSRTTKTQKERYPQFAARATRCGWVCVANTDAGYREIWVNHDKNGASVLDVKIAHCYTAASGAYLEVCETTRTDYTTDETEAARGVAW